MKILIFIVVLYYLYPIVTFVGDSMHPTYKDGEHILSVRVFSRKQMKVGNVYTYRTSQGTVVVKRLTRIKRTDKGDVYFFEGDNSRVSYDSRNYGYIKFSSIISKLIVQRDKNNE